MRIHSNTLTRNDFITAARHAGVDIVELDEHGSRSRARAFKFYLSGSSGRPGNQRDEPAATWDEWGIVFAHLFHIDPQAHCGKWPYQSAEHFHWVTGNRFRTLTPLLQHKRHKWGYGEPSVTGTYSVAQCECGAVQRWMIREHKWEEISA